MKTAAEVIENDSANLKIKVEGNKLPTGKSDEYALNASLSILRRLCLSPL